MQTITKPTQSQFVAVASIASELSAVMEVAKEISLAAANAKAIAFRAGEKARGFQPITDFINELAKETIELINDFNSHALTFYRLTVKEHYIADSYKRLEMSSKLAQGAYHAQSMQSSLDSSKLKLQDCRRQFKGHVLKLLDHLETVMHPARAARVIAANSRIEASQAGEYLQSLQAVAESVDKAAQVIHDNVQRCRSLLSAVLTV